MTEKQSPIGIVGSGSWATALIKMISDGDRPVKWWIRNPEKAVYISSHLHNPDYLSSVEIHPERQALTEIGQEIDYSHKLAAFSPIVEILMEARLVAA